MPGPDESEYWENLIQRARKAWAGAEESVRDAGRPSPGVFVPYTPQGPPPPAMEAKPPAGKYVDQPQGAYDPRPPREGDPRPTFDPGALWDWRHGLTQTGPAPHWLEGEQDAQDEPDKNTGTPYRDPSIEEAEYQWQKTHPRRRRDTGDL